MSVTEDMQDASTQADGGSEGSPDTAVITPARRVLLVWDAPNLDMGLGAILGGRPTAAHRPRFDALGRWLLEYTSDLVADSDDAADISLEPEATVFTNIAPGSADVVRPWVEALRNVGFAVFAKPKIDDDSDVDSDMLEHIALRRSEGLAAVLVASADGQAFRQPLEEIAREGTPVRCRNSSVRPPVVGMHRRRPSTPQRPGPGPAPGAGPNPRQQEQDPSTQKFNHATTSLRVAGAG
ncbi:hypothetical protein BN970_02729 [Mycolicibacterium conceptionense]|uniref:NYN domain-containing protein n=1 Tax=Mycolicibacterium conceptionense TaxID=451644 RepID=A0A0U1DFC7_9MYCO|nr:hypothetical protein BN970_02729 [Mycolicibacterium conceptionense]